MKKVLSALVLITIAFLVSQSVFAKDKSANGNAGEAEFKQHCAVCHPDGDNIINPKKTLHKKDLDANGIKTAADIIKKMRNPGPGMSQFDEKTISDQEAKQIAEYILKTFK